MACDCIATMNAALAEMNGKIAETLVLPYDGRRGYVCVTIEVEKIEPRTRRRPVAAPTFCPFCGERYEAERAVKADAA